MRVVEFSRALFAIASASFTLLILSLAFNYVPGTLSSPWHEGWVFGSALVVLAASVGMFFSRTALTSTLTIGAYQAIRAVTSVPQIVFRPRSIDAWYGFVEALTALLGAWILYATLRSRTREPEVPVAGRGSVRTAQILFGFCCVFYGWSHFTYAAHTASMVPTWLPNPFGFAYLTGLAHLAAGVGIIIRLFPRLAATLEAIMMSLFGLLVWIPSFFAQPPPPWATPPQNRWSELVVTFLLAASAWVVAASLRNCSWGYASRSSVASRSST